MRCPRCNSPAPHLHPAMQYEGEVQVCTHQFHLPQNIERNSDMKAYELLSTPDRWCKGNWAKDARGQVTKASGPDAVCWCLTGALWRIYMDRPHAYAAVKDRVVSVLERRTGRGGLVAFNDDFRTSYEDVIAVLKEANV